MPSRPVLIGRGLVTHTPTKQPVQPAPQVDRVHHPESEPTNPAPRPKNRGGHRVTCSQQNNGSQRYGGHSGQETPGPIPNPEVKPASPNGTAPDRMWESRTPPNNLSREGVTPAVAPSLHFRHSAFLPIIPAVKACVLEPHSVPRF